jgi:hypothetical protein
MFADVVMINSLHDWSAPEFGGDRRAQAEALAGGSFAGLQGRHGHQAVMDECRHELF